MITIVNFSHPLPEGREDVTRIVGAEYRVYDIMVQVDQLLPMRPQARTLVDQAVEAVGGNIRNVDCIILPGLAPVAVLIVAEFRKRGYEPNILRLAPVPGATPPRFEAVEIEILSGL